MAGSCSLPVLSNILSKFSIEWSRTFSIADVYGLSTTSMCKTIRHEIFACTIDRFLFQDILVYNPKKRPTAKQLIEEHAYFAHQPMIKLEKPYRTVIDRAIRLQTENLKHHPI